MLMQVGGEGSRPTFFEMSAAQNLPSSLRSALLYSLGVMAQRRPILHRVLDHSDEAYSLLMLLLELHSLRTADASFAEALYGLKRMPAEILSTGVAMTHQAQDSAVSQTRPLSRRQRGLSLLFLVGLPYLKLKLQSAYNTQRGGVLQAALWGRGDAEDVQFLETDNSETRTPSGNETAVSEIEIPMWQHWKERFLQALVRWYPWIHATNEGVTFVYQLLYLLDATGFYTPALHISGIHVRRASGQELMDSTKVIEERRNREFHRLRGPPFAQALQRVMLRTAYTVLDYAQTGLIASVFLFKMVEWWYQSAEQRVTAPSIYPPPPPPPQPKVAEGGIQLPADRRLCPICMRQRTNPALIAVSGFVFCYPCIFNYVTQYKRCPVTLSRASTSQIRRLFQDA
ncbi:unnamed protein product [Sphagnum compactum]